MDDLISRKVAIDALKQQAEIMSEWSNRYVEQRKGVLTAVNIIEDLSSAQPNLEKPNRSCKTCYYRDEFLGGVFFCRRLKESKRVKPNFWCKKWRGE